MLFALLTAHLLYHTHFVLSRTFFHFLWKHFFSISLSRLQVFSNSFSPQRNSYYHLLSGLSRTFFEKFWLFLIPSGIERRRRDLNPRAAINDLHPFQGCPFSLLGTSPNSLTSKVIFCYRIQIPGPERRGWDSNPCAREDKRFSRPPRYDRFGTSPSFARLVQREIYIITIPA